MLLRLPIRRCSFMIRDLSRETWVSATRRTTLQQSGIERPMTALQQLSLQQLSTLLYRVQT